MKTLNLAIERSDIARSQQIVSSLLDQDKLEPWAVHEDIYPVVQQVLNPPFINPHMAKMYAINREVAAYLPVAERGRLVKLEVTEYARREKLRVHDQPPSLPKISGFSDVEKAIDGNDGVDAAATMAAFMEQAGREEFARRMLLLGSGYLDSSLGHSLSCTAFILLEMLRRRDQDPWPAVLLLADYFCKGGFKSTIELRDAPVSGSNDESTYQQLGRAVSGTGIAALHHPITAYAIERSSHLLTKQERGHMQAVLREMMGEKEQDLYPLEKTGATDFPGVDEFLAVFTRRDVHRLVPLIKGSLATAEERNSLARHLITAVLQSYNGSYNPHNLTGLGSALWLMESFYNKPEIVVNGWLQYLDYFFGEIG